MLVQKLKKDVVDEFQLAEKYYGILSIINSLQLTEREIQLIAFTAIRGNISNMNYREEFCKRYKTTSPTINNIVSKLKRIGVFVKTEDVDSSYPKKIRVNPSIALDFKKDLMLAISLKHVTN
jgi:DNA-binding MarR family transcriptional regulator